MKKLILSILYALKRSYSFFKLSLGKRAGLIRSLMIMPYHGFGNKNEIYFLGRVLRDRGIGISQIEDSRWRNFRTMYKRFATWEIPGVRVKTEFGTHHKVVTTDSEGYFEVHLSIENPPSSSGPWHPVKVTLLDQVIRNQGEVSAVNSVFIPSEKVEYGVISDIDDTIVPTGATRLWTMLKTTFLQNVHTRLPFPGVAAFYQALAKGTDGVESNPFFYVSSSPWNLYDFLMEFLQVHGIPKGPLMLRDIGLSREQFIAGSHDEHKLLQVEKIFEMEKHLQFILIGDSGQKDPEIYLQVIKDFPGRVKMVYIRDVKESRQPDIEAIGVKIRQLGVELMLVPDTLSAARHALSKGWILAEEIAEIAQAKSEDEEMD